MDGCREAKIEGKFARVSRFALVLLEFRKLFSHTLPRPTSQDAVDCLKSILDSMYVYPRLIA
jgi:hypothetical protein